MRYRVSFTSKTAALTLQSKTDGQTVLGRWSAD